jgi:hypothetical protein
VRFCGLKTRRWFFHATCHFASRVQLPDCVDTAAVSDAVFRICFPSVSAAAPNPQPGGPPGEPCYAFEASWRIVTVCQGRKEWLRAPYPIEHFAISSDGSSLAFWKDDPIVFGHEEESGTSVGQWVTNLVIVSLSSDFKTTERKANYKSIPSLQATCGTIVGSYPAVPNLLAPSYPPSRDILTDESLEFSTSRIFRCSSDRTVVVSRTRGSAVGTSELVLSVNGREQRRFPPGLEEVKDGELADFSVSPNGNHIAYTYARKTNRGWESLLCVSRVHGSPVCTANLGESLSVSDDGQVLYTILLRGSYGGLRTHAALWSPRLPRRLILDQEQEVDSFRPQWITPDVATQLKKWASTLLDQSTTPR